MTLTPDTAHRLSKPTDERYTPPWIIERAQPIWLDPCTPPHNPTGAQVFYTRADNGLTKLWQWSLDQRQCVWVNPPYSTGQMALWANKIQWEYSLGVSPIYVLTSGDFTTKWFPMFFASASACVLLKKRVPYIYPGEDKPRPGSNFGNIIWGYTRDKADFFDRFGDLGYPLDLGR